MSRWIDQYFDRDETLPANGHYELVQIVNDKLTKVIGSARSGRGISGDLWGHIVPRLAAGETHEELTKIYRIRRVDDSR